MVKTAILSLAAAAVASAQVIPGEYIVQFRPNSGNAKRLNIMEQHNKEDIINVFEIGEFSGYAFKGSENMRLMLEENDQVLSVEPNQVVKAFEEKACSVETSRSWGLNRVNSRNRVSGTGPFSTENNVNTVDFYILDTGVHMSHNAFQFSGRTQGVDCSSGSCRDGAAPDRQGHGTHVAGTVCAEDYGVARKGDIVPVKVLGDNGSGSIAGVIGGVDWTVADCQNGKKCVGNMSLGGGFSSALNNAVNAAVNAGVVMVVAAGNENQNACNVSPASAANAITVGSTDINDNRSSFSNWGTCVDIFAPGSSITSAWWNSNTATNTISGTSMASPHVAGLAGLIWENDSSLSPAGVLAEMVRTGTPNAINNVGTGSPNVLAYYNC